MVRRNDWGPQSITSFPKDILADHFVDEEFGHLSSQRLPLFFQNYLTNSLKLKCPLYEVSYFIK